MNDDAALPCPDTPAPYFSLPLSSFRRINLSDLQGRPAVLVFYPGDWEPVSSEQLALYQEQLPEIHRFGAALIAISVDSVWSHAAFGRALGLSFPLLSDFHPKGAVSQAYGVYREVEGRSERALCVLDAEGRVYWCRVYPTNLNPGIDPILTALERIQAEKTEG